MAPPLEAQVNLANCVQIGIDDDPGYESYVAVFNFGRTDELVNLTVHDIVRQPSRRRTLIRLFAILGNGNYGEQESIRQHRTIDHEGLHSDDFGPDVNWGTWYVPQTLVSYTFIAAPGCITDLTLSLINGNLFDRYLYCNSIAVLPVSHFAVSNVTAESLNRTVYHELKYLTDSRATLQQPNREIGAMRVCQRTVRSSPSGKAR